MKIGLTISIIGHAAALLWGIISFTARPLEAKPTESLPVDIISTTEFTQLMAGNKTAPKAEKPKPLVEKVDEPKPAKDVAAKVENKPEIQAAKEEPPPPPPPPPEPKVAEQKPDKKAPEPKVDPLAEQMKKDEAKKLTGSKAKVPTPPKRPAPPQPKFDPNEITALLDKRKQHRLAATGPELNHERMFGASTGHAAKVSQNELEALRARLMSLWNVPPGVRNPDEVKVEIRIVLGRDRRLAAGPRVLTSGHSPLYQAALESALRAVFQGQPFDMLSPSTYEEWKEIDILFDPRDHFRG
jgi:outer membrane biosynthesis protein TonB